MSRRIGKTMGDMLRSMRPTEEHKQRAKERIKGANAPWWKGGVSVTSTGYRIVIAPDDYPFKQSLRSTGRILEHRMVMELHIGRALDRKEVVHHINGDRADNRIENLELITSHSEHMKQHEYVTVRVGMPCLFNCGRNSGVSDDGKHYKACKRCRQNRSLMANPNRDDTYEKPMLTVATIKKANKNETD